ncbi:uncharacterized protein LOC116949469 isoform X2 [Petromyzon marinus]|uniref:uncharacterized protein LOC116949469 isoform X2 n=1 Tax=Petromyzon marinus TaxID=7757 RepID=UPI003F71165E
MMPTVAHVVLLRPCDSAMPSLLPSALLLLALSAHCCSLYSPGLATTPHLGRWRQQHRRPRAVTSQQPPALLTARGGPLGEGSPAPGEEGQSSGNNEPVDGGGGEAVGGSSAATTLDPGRPLRPATPLFSRPTESGDDRTPPPRFDPANDTDANQNSSRDGSSEEGSSWTRPLACSALPAFTFLLLWGLFNCAIFARRGAVAPAAAADDDDDGDRLRCFAAAANALLLAFAGLRVALTALVLSSAELQGLIASSPTPQLRGEARGGFSAALVAALSLHELALPCLAAAFAALLLHFVPPAARKPLPSSPSSSSSLSLISSSLPSPASGRARGALLAVVFSTHLCVAALACLAFATRPAKAVFLLAVPRGFLVAWGLALAGVCLATAACGPLGGAGRSDRRQASTAIGACFAGSSCLLMLACCLHGAEAVFAVLGVGAGPGVGPPLLAARLVCELCAALALCAASSLWLRRGPRAGFAAAASSSSSSRRWQQQDEAEMTDEARKRRAKRNGRHSAPLKHADVMGASYDSVRPALAGEARESAPDPPSPRCVADGVALGSAVRFSVGDERVQLLQGNGEEEVDDEVEGVMLGVTPVDRSSGGGGTSSSSASQACSWRDAAIGSEDDNQSSLRELTQRTRYGNFAGGGGGGGGGDYDVPSGAFRAGDFMWDDFIRPPSPINLQGSIDDALWRRSLIVRSLFEEEEEDDDNEKRVARNVGEDG